MTCDMYVLTVLGCICAMLTFLCAALLFCSALRILTNRRKPRTQRLPLPPGPPANPLIGHLRSIPSTNVEEVFREWGKTYGSSWLNFFSHDAHED